MKNEVRIQIIDNKPYFTIRDIMNILYNKSHNTSTMVRLINKKDIFKMPLKTNGGEQLFWVTNEDGLFELLQRSQSKKKSFLKFILIGEMRKRGITLKDREERQVGEQYCTYSRRKMQDVVMVGIHRIKCLHGECKLCPYRIKILAEVKKSNKRGKNKNDK